MNALNSAVVGPEEDRAVWRDAGMDQDDGESRTRFAMTDALASLFGFEVVFPGKIAMKNPLSEFAVSEQCLASWLDGEKVMNHGRLV